jgi:hypothetical protein
VEGAQLGAAAAGDRAERQLAAWMERKRREGEVDLGGAAAENSKEDAWG